MVVHIKEQHIDKGKSRDQRRRPVRQTRQKDTWRGNYQRRRSVKKRMERIWRGQWNGVQMRQ